MMSYGELASILLSILAAALWNERRITKIETLLTNHLSHHESFESAFTKILDAALGKKA
jgi:hypothetical protein